MPLTRSDIDDILDSLDAEIASAPEGAEAHAYFTGSQVFYDLALAEADIAYVAERLRALVIKYELPRADAT